MAKRREHQNSAEEIAEEELSKHMGIDIEECHNFLNPNDEDDTNRFIKAHLRTPEQKKWLDEQDLSLSDVNHGRFTEAQEPFIIKMHEDWNTKLGRKIFGY